MKIELSLSLIVLLVLALQPASGHSGYVINSAFTVIPPSIDGVISTGEWKNPNALTYAGLGAVTLYVMNDNDNLYLAVTYNDFTPQGTDLTGFAFDADHDGNLTTGREDGVAVWLQLGNSFDGYYDPADYRNIGIDTLQNLNASVKYNQGNWTIEWSKPLNSGDVQDMAVSPGDTIGFYSRIYDDFNGTLSITNNVVESANSIMAAKGVYPPGGIGSDASTYADIVLAPVDTEPPLVTNPNAIPFAIPDDTDNNATCSGTICSEVTILNVSAADASGVAGVRINLSAIGGQAVQPMTLIAGDSFSGIWTATTSASAGKVGLHNLQVNATDVWVNSNTSVNIILRVALNGDANNDGSKTLVDASYIAKAVLGKPGFVLTYPGVGDVNGDCAVTLVDASFLAKNVLGKPGFSPLK